jgi:hypothetical protein
MPYEQEDMQQVFDSLLDYGVKRIAHKLGDISSVEHLMELS